MKSWMKKRLFLKALSLSSLLALASPISADVHFQFFEGAPKDKFVISNKGECDLSNVNLIIDLSKTSSGLVFDVTESGEGVEVYQPFEITTGRELLAKLPDVSDGDDILALELSKFEGGDKISFTIDVDDTNSSRQITVSDKEFSGVEVILYTEKGLFMSVVGKIPSATIALKTCPQT